MLAGLAGEFLSDFQLCETMGAMDDLTLGWILIGSIILVISRLSSISNPGESSTLVPTAVQNVCNRVVEFLFLIIPDESFSSMPGSSLRGPSYYDSSSRWR